MRGAKRSIRRSLVTKLRRLPSSLVGSDGALAPEVGPEWGSNSRWWSRRAGSGIARYFCGPAVAQADLRSALGVACWGETLVLAQQFIAYGR